VRQRIQKHAEAVGRPVPKLSVWVPVALEPGPGALAQLQGQLAVYLGAPGYGELFASVGFEALVERARSGARRAELASAIPEELVAQIGALGTSDVIVRRIAAYHDAGADHVGVVPSTAEDPAGRRVMAVLAHEAVSE
jgi:alkanesulfonate monooxygenase SsuD/methylene tetrahydromethanopterin reductase-like flavin-dependent oxidoreductase (luciferase family)